MTSECIEISCPACSFSQSVPLRSLPSKPVRATCPKCRNSFSFDGHLQVLTPPAETLKMSAPVTENNSRVTSNPSRNRYAESIGRLLKNPVITSGVFISVAFALLAFGAPWYVAIIALLTVQYWYAPLVVYLTQRIPTQQPLRAVTDDTPLPPEHYRFFDRIIPVLEAAGFALKGRFANDDHSMPVSGTVTLLQNLATSDVAHLLVLLRNGRTGEMIGFSRSRSDGSRIATGWSNTHSPFPANPQDSVLRIGEKIDPLDLWHIHQARTAADPRAIRNETISDALGYQVNMEREGVRTKISSGMWQPASQPGFIRPTVKGAFSMCLRMLFPWKHLDRMRARREARRYLRKKTAAIEEE